MVIPSSIMVVDDDHDQANLFNLFLARLGESTRFHSTAPLVSTQTL